MLIVNYLDMHPGAVAKSGNPGGGAGPRFQNRGSIDILDCIIHTVTKILLDFIL